jgi:hypothetical protein
MKLIIEQDVAQQVLNMIAKLPYQDVFQLVPKLLQLPVLAEAEEAAPLVDVTPAAAPANDVLSAAEAASTSVAQEIASS